jgi:CheY-like chemotaxis protein
MIERLTSTKCHQVTAEARTGLPDAPVADGSKNRTVSVASAAEAFDLLQTRRVNVLLADIVMPGADGLLCAPSFRHGHTLLSSR